jgi:hypothetical protein
MKEISALYSQKPLMNFDADIGHRSMRSLQEMEHLESVQTLLLRFASVCTTEREGEKFEQGEQVRQ